MDVRTGAERDVTSAFPTPQYTPFWWTADGQSVLARPPISGSRWCERVHHRTTATAVGRPQGEGDRGEQQVPALAEQRVARRPLDRLRRAAAGQQVVVVDGHAEQVAVSGSRSPTSSAGTTSHAGRPDGRTLYFLSRRSGEFEVWALPFNPEAGAAAGTPRQTARICQTRSVTSCVRPGRSSSRISGTQLAVPIEELTSRVAVVPIRQTVLRRSDLRYHSHVTDFVRTDSQKDDASTTLRSKRDRARRPARRAQRRRHARGDGAGGVRDPGTPRSRPAAEEARRVELKISEIELGEIARRLENEGRDSEVGSGAPKADTGPRYASDTVRKLFRDVAKVIHPDLARDDHARDRRHSS